jgi:diaminopimelate decarboxylase
LISQYFVKDGAFHIDGVGLKPILEKHETPFYLYSAAVLRNKYRVFAEHFPGYEVFYSFKANPNLAICKTLLELGANADVSSMGEIQAAFEVGFRAGDIAFVGPGKTEQEIEYAIERGVYTIAAESVYELELIETLARKLNKQVGVLLRINTLEKPISPEMMVGGPSKFGFDEETVAGEVRAVALEKANIIGIHVYSASQVLDVDFISAHLDYVLDLALRLSGEIGFELKCIDFGGGFGVPYQEGQIDLDLKRISGSAKQVRQTIDRVSPGCRLIFEIGRFLVAEAGIYVTTAIRVKPSRGKCFIITDGGMNHFSRPVFMRVNHQVRILNKITSEPTVRCNIAGPICTPIDISGRDVELPKPERGDVVGILGAGAYGFTMSMVNFMSLGWPGEVMVDRGEIHLIRRPRSAESFFSDQALP